MSRSIARLKEKARIHEQNEEWGEAIKAYQQALEIAEEAEGEGELSLYNRIGDLFLRDGRQDEAVRYYELAADRYEVAGLYNSAIALCNKVLRHDPQRPEPYYKLSRLTLAQGFFSEARRWSVEYAERMIRAGRRKEAFAALNEFASHASDPEIRELLAQYLLAHDETAEALSQLLEAYQARLQGGQTEQAEALRKKILTLDPTADLSMPGSPASPAAARVTDDTGPIGGLDNGFGFDDLEGLPSLHLETAADSAGIENKVPTVVQAEPVDIDLTLIVAPTAGVAEPEAISELEPEPELIELPALLDEGGLLDLEPIGPDLGGEDDSDLPPLPLLGEPHSPPAPETAPIVLAEPELVAAPEEPASPGAPPTVEEAPSTGGFGIDALLESLVAGSGEPVVEPVVEPTIDPIVRPVAEPEVVQHPIPGPEPGSGAGEAATNYIDLADLLQDESSSEQGLSRYVVEAPEPSGDEDRDFMDMLSEFKSKVSEHLGEEDAESRYDLGLAFKEMGLLDEAIAQFQVALRGMEGRLKVYEELGDCFVLKGDYSVALKILQGALQLADDGSAELIGVHYKLGRSYEELGRVAEARDAYERVIALDLEFRDASSRLARL